MKRDTKTVEDIAYQLYQNRIAKGIEGNAETDWQEAQRIVQELTNRKNPWRRFIDYWEMTRVEQGLETLVRDLQNLAIFDLLALLANVTIIVGLFAFISGGEQQRRNTEVYEAWQVITAAYEQTGSGGRIKALEFLNSSPGVPGRRRWWGGVWPAESLAGVDVSNAYLADIQLPGADLREANLQKANFGCSSLPPKKRVQCANLQKANLWRADLQTADFGHANLRAVRLTGANLQGTYLWRADLRKARLDDANLQEADLTYANMELTFLPHANLQKAVLADASLQMAYLYEVNLQGANLLRVDLRKAFLVIADLQGANLNDTNLEFANFQSANLQQADLQDANLQGTNLEKANLQEANLKNANLHKAFLNQTKFQGASLENTKMEAAIFLGANLTNTKGFHPKQLQGKDSPLLCATELPKNINLDPNRDCERLPAILLERYPANFPLEDQTLQPRQFSSLDEAQKFVESVKAEIK